MKLHATLLAPLAVIATSSAAAGQTPLPAAMEIEDIEIGTGAEARKRDIVTVHYTGWLHVDGVRGKRVDSSRGSEPFTFRLGAGEVIEGWDVGVAGMKEGGLRTLIIPPELGYGSKTSGAVPANSSLIFEIELLKVR